MTEVMNRPAGAQAGIKTLPLLPFSFEAVLGDQLRGVSPRRLAAFLDRYLLAEVTIAIERIGNNLVDRASIAMFRPPIAESTERFETAVCAAGLPAKVETALLDASCHMPVGEDVVGALVRIAQRIARERDLQLTGADREGILGLDVEGKDAGRLAFEHAAARSGHKVVARAYGSSALESAIKDAFAGLGDEVGYGLTEAEQRVLVTAATAMLVRVEPLGPAMPIEWFENRLGSHVTHVILERLRHEGLVQVMSNTAVTMPLPSQPRAQPRADIDEA